MLLSDERSSNISRRARRGYSRHSSHDDGSPECTIAGETWKARCDVLGRGEVVRLELQPIRLQAKTCTSTSPLSRHLRLSIIWS